MWSLLFKNRPSNQHQLSSVHVISTILLTLINFSIRILQVFAVIGLYEWFHCKETGKKVAFSEQYPIDCGRNRVQDMQGCLRGNMPEVITFTLIYGLELRESYPFNARDGRCPYELSTDYKSMGYIRADEKEVIRVKLEDVTKVLLHSPIIVNMRAGDRLKDFGGGIDQDEDCKEDTYHSMLLVGLGMENGIDYVIVRNSWSPRWAEDGYYRMSYKKAGKCLHPGMIYTLNDKSFTVSEDYKD